jgi:cysteine dioxygenase
MANINELERVITEVLTTADTCEEKKVKMIAALEPLHLESSDWSKYLFWEPGSYTRNAIINNDLFTLLALCWDKGCSSPIHDHPCDGCWIVGLAGAIDEKKYVVNKDDTLKEVSTCTCQAGEISWMHNSVGLHKVSNPSQENRAVTLHIYSPPFKVCRGYNEKGEYWYCTPRFYSVNGEKVEA